MKKGIQGMGWFLRRTRDPLALSAFYEQALGLPRMRSWDVESTSGSMCWVGDVGVIEFNRLHADTEFNPSLSQATPIFRSWALDESISRILAAGGSAASEEQDARATTHFFADPLGYRFGVEDVSLQSNWQTDQRAALAWQAGDIYLPGRIGIDGAVQGMSRIVHFTNDLAAERAFLVAMGIAKITENVFDLGRHCAVELRENQMSMEAVSERDMVHDCWIMRIFGMQAMRQKLTAQGGSLLCELHFDGGDLEYALTPSNRLIGWQERKPYNPDVAMTHMVEDLNARSRWLTA